MTCYNIVPVVLSYFCKDLNVLLSVLVTIHIDYTILPTSNLCLAFTKFILKRINQDS